MTQLKWHNISESDSVLFLTTTVDQSGLLSFTLEGNIIDEEGAPFSVGEFAFKPDRIEKAAAYYVASFDDVKIVRQTIWEK